MFLSLIVLNRSFLFYLFRSICILQRLLIVLFYRLIYSLKTLQIVSEVKLLISPAMEATVLEITPVSKSNNGLYFNCSLSIYLFLLLVSYSAGVRIKLRHSVIITHKHANT